MKIYRLLLILKKTSNKVWIAERLGVSKTLLSLWLSGERDIPESHKIKIADILNMPISELV